MLLTSIDGAAVVVGFVVAAAAAVAAVAYATVSCEMPSTLIVCVVTLSVPLV